MINTVEQLEKLNNGYVIFKGEKKERVVVTTPKLATKKCEFCSTLLAGVKCVRHDKGNDRLYNECFKCYTFVIGKYEQ